MYEQDYYYLFTGIFVIFISVLHALTAYRKGRTDQYIHMDHNKRKTISDAAWFIACVAALTPITVYGFLGLAWY